MGLFSSTNKTAAFPWKHIDTTAQLDEALQASDNAKVFFKHSTRCPVSAMALRSFERDWNTEAPNYELYFIDLIAHRAVSNAIAAKLDVVHESPQAIVVKGGEVIYDASHHNIDAGDIQDL